MRAGRETDPGGAASLALLLVVSPVAVQALVVWCLGVNMLVWDEFYYVDFIQAVRSGQPWLSWLWRQHNEHRMVPMKLVMAALAGTSWDNRVEMGVSVALAAGIVAALWAIAHSAGSGRAWRFAPVAWLACSLAQYQNMLYGMQMCFYQTALGAVAALACLVRRSTSWLLLAAASACLASYSNVNGFAVWPAGFLTLLLRADRSRRALALWTAAGVACVGVYVAGLQWPDGVPRPPLALASARGFLSFGLALLGQPLGAGSFRTSQAVGLGLTLLVGTLAWRRRRWPREQLGVEAPLWGLVAFALVSSALTAFGRFPLGRGGLASRYVVFSLLAVAAAWLLAHRDDAAAAPGAVGRPRLVPLAAPVLLLGLVASNLQGLDEAFAWRRARLVERYKLHTADVRPDSDLSDIYFPSDLRRLLPYLRSERLGPFAEPLDYLLALSWRDATPAADLAPRSALEQEFACPVETLRDASVSLAMNGRRNPTRLVVSLRDGATELARRVFAPREIGDNQWADLRLERPLAPCRGRRLSLVIEAPEGGAGAIMTAWTHPAHVEGTLRQAGQVIPGRALALELNVLHYRARP